MMFVRLKKKLCIPQENFTISLDTPVFFLLTLYFFIN